MSSPTTKRQSSSDFYPFGVCLAEYALFGLDRWVVLIGWSFASLELYGTMSPNGGATKEKSKMAKNENPFEHLQDDGLGGYDQLNGDVMSFPFIKIIQDMSPQHKETKPEYIEGAKVGMLYNSITNRLFDTANDGPLAVVIGKFERYFIEWKPNRGGFAGAHSPEHVNKLLAEGHLMLDEKNRIVDPSTGNHFSDTYVYYIMLPDFLEEGVCLLSLSSTQLKTAKKLNRNLMSTVIPGTRQKALPHHMIFELSTPLMSNDQGEWHGLKVTFKEFVNPEVFAEVTSARKELPDAQPDLRALDSGDDGAQEAIDVTPTGEQKF